MAKKVKKENSSKPKGADINKALIENFVNMQKALTHLAVKFDSLSDQMTKLLQIFELSAKSFSEKAPGQEDKEFLDKLNVLLEQNKLIAKGITIMEEKVREKMQQPGMMQQLPQFQPMPNFQQQTQDYQQSMAQRKIPPK
jgi:hypothetical protein